MMDRQRMIEREWSVTREGTPHVYYAAAAAELVREGRLTVEAWRDLVGLPPISTGG